MSIVIRSKEVKLTIQALSLRWSTLVERWDLKKKQMTKTKRNRNRGFSEIWTETKLWYKILKPQTTNNYEYHLDHVLLNTR